MRHDALTASLCVVVAIASWSCSASSPVVDWTRGSGVLALGRDHTCRVTPERTVECWGRNARGQLGDGTRQDRGVPAPVAGLDGVVRVAAAPGRTCALRSSGEVLCWGMRVGLVGSTVLEDLAQDRLVPTRVAGIDDAVDLSLGDEWSCVLRRDGRVTCWLGPARYSPVDGPLDDVFGDVPGLSGVVEIAAAAQSCVRHESGAVTCFHFGPYRDAERNVEIEVISVPGITDATRISVASGWWTGETQCVVHQGGAVSCWGNWLLDDDAVSSPQPVRIGDIDDAVDVDVAPGHACVLHRSGRVSCWGLGGFGALGQGALESAPDPVTVTGLHDAIAIGVGGAGAEGHSCAVRRTGPVVCWGWDGFGQLGVGGESQQRRPLRVPGLTDVVQIGAGSNHTCAVRHGGELLCWGDDANGQIASTSGCDSSVPGTLDGVGSVTLVEASELGTCAVLTSGEVACWGDSGLGSIGLDVRRVYPWEPRILPGISGVRSITIGRDVEGYVDGCLVRDSGRVECSTNSFYPFDGEWLDDGRVVVEGVADAVRATYGRVGQCALRDNGDITCWDHSAPWIPVRPGDLAVDAGGMVLCLIRASGRAVCVGDGTYGATGTGELESWHVEDEPREVAGLDDAVDLSVGEEAVVCALREGGRVACWGWTWSGVFGVPEPTLSPAPTEIAGLDDVVQVAAGGHHVCARHESGEVSCWGMNQHGQLGDGRTLYRAQPTPVARD